MPALSVDPRQPEPAQIMRAAARLRDGELVAFPTETVYGLGARALDARAVAKIYAAKGRPSFNPLIVHVHAASAARELASSWPSIAEQLSARFWPGPLTLVLPKRAQIPDLVTAGLGTVGLRAPDHPVAQALLAAAGPLAAPSANRYQAISPTSAAHVLRSLGEHTFVLDGGPTRVGIESTVVGLGDPERPALLRLGGLPAADIEAVIGRPLLRPLVPEGEQARSSPGQVGRHYAPAGRVELLAREQLCARLEAGAGLARPLGILALEGGPSLPVREDDVLMTLPRAPQDYARLIYAALHSLDELGCATLLIEALPPEPAWDALRDRLARADQ